MPAVYQIKHGKVSSEGMINNRLVPKIKHGKFQETDITFRWLYQDFDDDVSLDSSETVSLGWGVGSV